MARSRTIVELNGEEIARRYPEQFTVEREMRKRSPERVYLDWGQVGRGMTIVPPYAARACDGAPISMPLHWREIERLALSRSKKPPIEHFRRYNIASVIDMLKNGGDPWAGRRRSSLTPLIEADYGCFWTGRVHHNM